MSHRRNRKKETKKTKNDLMDHEKISRADYDELRLALQPYVEGFIEEFTQNGGYLGDLVDYAPLFTFVCGKCKRNQLIGSNLRVYK